MKKVSGSTFDREVLDANVPVLVDFYSDHCGPCRKMASQLNKLHSQAKGRYKVVKVDTDAESGLANDYQVTSLPTLIVFTRGRATKRLVGLQDNLTLMMALGLV
ncbi:thioredoxin [Rhodopirellula maiorica SM1]|uniref:Thioredoxin n=1 Tax=Rhodopirellula maiorica SM1 TaxID=1265738 RepID=M5RH72_9BACT|nr:thioredoxin domain-containing protein [Rhodopirellula maiorica]EMI18690.1 thioredoxin [Rhodopirellula maiorica SM1]